MADASEVAERSADFSPVLDERTWRLVAAAEAKRFGYSGISQVSRATGLARETIRRDMTELEAGEGPSSSGRIRIPGGGRKRLVDTDPTVFSDLESLVEPTELAGPESPLRWTVKSVRTLAKELPKLAHRFLTDLMPQLLHALGYSLQANRKTLEGGDHPDRDLQFGSINEQVQAFQHEGQPVMSVDAKKMELVDYCRNGGREWHPEGEPEEANVYDFVEEAERATPYGVNDPAQNTGWVSVGIDHDAAAFAAESIGRWQHMIGEPLLPDRQADAHCGRCGGQQR